MNDRRRRVNEAVKQVLSEAIRELKDPRVGFVTVTGTEVTTDLGYAKVFISVYGDDRKRERTLAGLAAAHGYLQSRVAKELKLRRTPRLTFEYDASVEYGVRMSQLIDANAPTEPAQSDDQTGD
jgi:ribosome-binding factor A